MDIGILVLLSFLSLPFWNEAEELGKKSGKLPKILQVLRLRISLKQRWFKGYVILIALWATIIFLPDDSGEVYKADTKSILMMLAVQVALFIALAYKIKFNSNKNRE